MEYLRVVQFLIEISYEVIKSFSSIIAFTANVCLVEQMRNPWHSQMFNQAGQISSHRKVSCYGNKVILRGPHFCKKFST
jgi:hypothetical protein